MKLPHMGYCPEAEIVVPLQPETRSKKLPKTSSINYEDYTLLYIGV